MGLGSVKWKILSILGGWSLFFFFSFPGGVVLACMILLGDQTPTHLLDHTGIYSSWIIILYAHVQSSSK